MCEYLKKKNNHLLFYCRNYILSAYFTVSVIKFITIFLKLHDKNSQKYDNLRKYKSKIRGAQ